MSEVNVWTSRSDQAPPEGRDPGLRIVVDHVAGSRRGQRQLLEAGDRVRFGRHPDNEVVFDAHRDLDASSRHAEIRWTDQALVLRDVGSSNGTYVEGERVTVVPLVVGEPVVVEFGRGGPRVRIFVGDEAALSELPEIPPEPAAAGQAPRLQALVWVGIAVLLASMIAAIWWRIAE